MASKVQEMVEKFVSANNHETSVVYRLLDIVSELGELSKELLKSSNYGKQPIAVNDETKEEFGDTLFSMLCLANSLGIDIEKQIEQTLQKYKSRMNKTGTISSN